MVIVFVHLGPSRARWLIPNALATKARFSIPVVIATNSERVSSDAHAAGLEIVELRDDYVRELHEMAQVVPSTTYRGGFWLMTTGRFACLSEVHAAIGDAEILHIESDVYLMPNLDLTKFSLLPTSLSFGLADPTLGSGAILYSRSQASTDLFVAKLLYAVSKFGPANDMEALRLLWQGNKPLISLLPSLPSANAPLLNHDLFRDYGDLMSQGVEHFRGFFDLSAIGQYLFGTDGRNLRGLVKRFCDPPSISLQPSAMRYSFDGNELVVEPAQGSDISQRLPILSLHIHSKRLDILASQPSLWKFPRGPVSSANVKTTFDSWAFGQWLRDSVLVQR